MFRPIEKTQPAEVVAVVVDGCAYICALFRKHNTPAGCPQFRAVITWNDPTNNQAGARVYEFRGSYCNDKEEARQIVAHMLEAWKK